MAEVISIASLIKKIIAYNPQADVELIKRAYIFSREAHCAQKRIEGTPYISHPLAVADILADMKMDVLTIGAGLLHDTIEDTGTTKEEIEDMFGKEIAFLVDSLTKLSKLQFRTKQEAQAENFRKMLIAVAEDIRVIMIKFADRLHNMRTIQYLPAEKQRAIAEETIEIYAPLANRLGIGWLKTELEDLSFKVLMPELYQDLVKKVAKRKAEQEGYIKAIINTIEERLKVEHIPASITGRVKHYYGIYQKMLKQKIPFEEVYDVLGIRIITDTVANCYHILGVIHSLWATVPGRFKDYISMPKSNMYQSLHTTVVGPQGEKVEFQIRTEEMHRIAEQGIAAHWKYKEKGHLDERDAKYIAWLRELVNSLKEHRDPREFLEAIKGEVVSDVVYVFTPKGEIKELPIGATPVDFAYAVHTEIGNKCVGAKVNGKLVPLRYKLKSGDTVEVITAPNHVPSKDWLSFVVTQKARSKIKQWIKTAERKQAFELGSKLIDDEMRKHDIPFNTLKQRQDELARLFNMKSYEDLVVSVGYGKVSAQQIIHKLIPEKVKPSRVQEQEKPRVVKGISIKGMDEILYHTSRCCYPVPGDDLVGYVTRGRGVTIHRRGCPNFEKLAVDEARIIEVTWKADDSFAPAKLYIETIDKPGMLASISSLISSFNVNITGVKAFSTPDRKAHLELILQVRDRIQLSGIIQKISQMEGILNVKR
ncbi:MAG: bifunctional (p)ppGpp synthetase/guanosine-3',5'-bis(diphosphate) 3'-pyrophosphohydrolase [Thermodesulfovibrionales bacterium]|nr:bifunctional (p)ppGpp synthetase/guanosine-3',5'-bis(diphosphate) 3'-pyrophosphohydrolase [Thermodesulfovibrionales bacterium]